MPSLKNKAENRLDICVTYIKESKSSKSKGLSTERNYITGCNFSLFLLGLLKLHWNSILEGRVRFPGCGFNGTCHQIKATLTVDQLEHRLYRDTSGNDTSSSPAMEQEPPQFKDHLYKDTLRNGTSSCPATEQEPPLHGLIQGSSL